MGVVLVAALEVIFRIHGHITGRYLDILVVGDVDACGIVHLIIGASGNRETTDRPLSMVEHRIDIGREHALILVVNLHGWIGPPKEGLRQIGTV